MGEPCGVGAIPPFDALVVLQLRSDGCSLVEWGAGGVGKASRIHRGWIVLPGLQESVPHQSPGSRPGLVWGRLFEATSAAGM